MRQVENRSEVTRRPGKIDGHDRPRSFTRDLGDALGVERQIARLNLAEDRPRPTVHHDVRRGGPGDGRNDHLVLGTDAGSDQRQMQGCGARRDGEGVSCSSVGREPSLELLRTGPRREPARAQDVRDGIDLLVADRGRLKGKERRAAAGRCFRRHVHCPRYPGIATGFPVVTKPILSAAWVARARASSRDVPTARTKPARSDPLRSGPKTQPGRR